MKSRIVIEYTPYGSNKTRFSAATLDSYGGDRVHLDTIYGRQTFSRLDGRWIDGDCLNFVDGRIHQFEDLEREIESGDAFIRFESNMAEPSESLPSQPAQTC